MFGIGTGEILIILLIALLVLGPDELPRVARTLGKTFRKIQHATDDIKHTITAELDEEEPSKEPPEEHRREPGIHDDADDPQKPEPPVPTEGDGPKQMPD